MMVNPYLEILVEEPSMEAFLHELLPRLFPVEIARTIAARINPAGNRSHSFVKFRDALIEAMA